jgi:hypothetical protein
MAPYVRWRNGFVYRFIHPVSLGELRRLVAEGFAADIRVPRVWEGDVRSFRGPKRLAARLFNRARNSAAARRVLLPLSPFFQVVATKI